MIVEGTQQVSASCEQLRWASHPLVGAGHVHSPTHEMEACPVNVR
jgi:hypothetical protein